MLKATSRASTDSILDYLAWTEANEPDVWLQDDYRIAWITVLRASRGERSPHVSATYAVLGLHPDKVSPAIVERRKALLGADYSKFFPAAEQRLPPKKLAQSVRHSGRPMRRAA